ncbi:MAG TPA: hypothetical protein VNH64_11120 [Parvularculaceae bacterium]|nr:hypothetical protein [Parvularculaceae bacterium]
MSRIRTAALLALLPLAACASTPKAGKTAETRPVDYKARYNHCMDVAWASNIEWKTRKAMCRAEAENGDSELGSGGDKTKDKQ